MIVNDLDCVVKMMDANKDHEGAEALEMESSMYEEVGNLSGDVLPNLCSVVVSLLVVLG